MADNRVQYIDHEKHKKSVAEYFSGATRFWDKVYDPSCLEINKFLSYQITNRKNIAMNLLAQFAGNQSLAVLDAGCGTGEEMEHLLSCGHDVTGVDISENMVTKAEQRLNKYSADSYRCQVGDVENLSFENNSFDAVLSLGVLMYLPVDKLALNEFWRTLKPGGMLLLGLTNMVRLNILFDPFYAYRGLQYAIHRYSRRARTVDDSFDPMDISSNTNFRHRRHWCSRLQKLLWDHNFSDVKIIGIDYGPLTFMRKKFMQYESNVAISEQIVRFSQCRGGEWLQMLANQWVVSAVKR